MKPDDRLRWIYAAETPEELSARYDAWSDTYERTMLEDLGFRVPDIAAETVMRWLPRDARILDAGCGTGLAARHARPGRSEGHLPHPPGARSAHPLGLRRRPLRRGRLGGGVQRRPCHRAGPRRSGPDHPTGRRDPAHRARRLLPPVLVYGVIIGLPDDSRQELEHLERAISDMHDELKSINPELEFQVACYSISPIVGTPQWDYMNREGLLRFDDPGVVGEFWTASCDTHHMSYEEVSDWQVRLAEIGKSSSNRLNYHGGLTVVGNGA